MFKENDSAETTVAEKAPSRKRKKKKKKQKVEASNANDDDDDASTAVGSPGIEIMRDVQFSFLTMVSKVWIVFNL